MLISLDSGDPDEVRQVLEWGFPVGKITTNPTTVSAAISRINSLESGEVDVYEVWNRILDITDRTGCHVSGETIGTPDYDPDHMNPAMFVEEAYRIAEHDERMVVKLPAVEPAIAAAHQIRGKVKINWTLVFSRHQAVVAADHSVDTDYVSAFVGRIDDKLKKPNAGMKLVREIINDYVERTLSARVLTASVRSEDHMRIAGDYGSDVVTIPFRTFREMYEKEGDGAVERVCELRKKYGWVKPVKPINPTYSKSLDRARMEQWERELLDAGVKRFLDDAASANYSVLRKAV